MFNAVKKFLSKMVSSAAPSFGSSEITEIQTTLPPAETFFQSEVVINEPKIKQLKRQIISKAQKE